MPRRVPASALLALCVAALCAPDGAEAGSAAAKLLINNVLKGKITVFNSNDQNYDRFAALRGVPNISNDQNNWASGNLVYDSTTASVFAASQCAARNNCSGASSVVQMNMQGKIAKVLSHAKITSADVNDIAITQKQVNSKPAPRLLIATEKGVYEVNFDPKICPKGCVLGTFFVPPTVNKDTFRAEVEVSDDYSKVYVLQYAVLQGSTLIRNASVTECSFTPSMIDVSQTYTLQGGDLPCKGAKVVVKDWGYKDASPQSLSYTKPGGAAQLAVVERDNDGEVQLKATSRKMEVVVAMDSSASMTAAMWSNTKKASATLLEALHGVTSKDSSIALKMGSIAYASAYKTISNMTSNLTVAKGNILEKIGTDNSLKYDSAYGCTYYTMALIGCAEKFEASTDALRVCVLLTDGGNNDGLCKNESTALVNYYDWSNATTNRDSYVGYQLKFPGHPGGGSALDPYCDGCDLSSVGHYVKYRCGGNATDIPGIRKEGACSSESDAGGAGKTCNLKEVGAGAQMFKCGILYEMKAGVARINQFCRKHGLSRTCTTVGIADKIKAMGVKIFGVAIQPDSGKIDAAGLQNIFRFTSCCDSMTDSKCKVLNSWNGVYTSENNASCPRYACPWYAVAADTAKFLQSATSLGKSIGSLLPEIASKVATGSGGTAGAGLHTYAVANGAHKHLVRTERSRVPSAFKAAFKTDIFDPYAVTTGPDGKYYISDYSFNAPMVVNSSGAPDKLLGDTSNIVPTGFMAFTPGPWTNSRVTSPSATQFDVQAGVKNTIAIDALSYDGKAYTKSDGDFKLTTEGVVDVNGENLTVSTVVTNVTCSSSNNKCTIPYMLSVVTADPMGYYTLTVTVGSGALARVIDKGRFLARVVPGIPKPVSCTTSLTGSNVVVTAGKNATVRVLAKDVYSNLVIKDTFGNTTFRQTLKRAGLSNSVVKSVANKNGSYDMTYQRTIAGSYDMLIEYLPPRYSMGTTAAYVGGAALTVEPEDAISASGTKGPLSLCFSDCFSSYGNTSTFTIVPRDRFGNALKKKGAKFKLTVSTIGSNANKSWVAAAESSLNKLSYTVDGGYKTSWRENSQNDYKINIQFGGKHITGSPFRVRVTPFILPSASKSTAKVAATSIEAGKTTKASVVINDVHGKPYTAVGVNISVTLSSTLQRPGLAPTQVAYSGCRGANKAVASFTGQGGVRGTITLLQADPKASTSLSVKLTGLDASAGPFPWHVHEAPVNSEGDVACKSTLGHFNPVGVADLGELSKKHGDLPKQSSVTASYTDKTLPLFGVSSVAGRSITLHFANKSRYACATLVALPQHAYMQREGSTNKYTCTVTGELAAKYTVRVQLATILDTSGRQGGLADIKPDSALLTITPAATSPAGSRILFDGTRDSVAVAGSTRNITVAAQDQYGNTKVGTSDKFSMQLSTQLVDKVNVTKTTSLTLRSSFAGSAARASKGAYLATYRATVAGIYKMDASIDQGGMISGSGRGVRVKHAECAANKCVTTRQPAGSVSLSSSVAWSIAPHDRFGNAITNDPKLVFSVAYAVANPVGLADTDTSTAAAQQKDMSGIPTSAKYDPGSGTYEIDYSQTFGSSGSFYTATITLGDKTKNSTALPALAGSPFKVQIMGADCDSADFRALVNWAMNCGCGAIMLIGAFTSAWYYQVRSHNFIALTSPKISQVILWGTILHLSTVPLWSVELNTENDSLMDQAGVNFCSLRMWVFGLTFVIMWGTIALKTYRVKALVVSKATKHSDMVELTDSKLYKYLGLLVLIEVVILLVYTFIGKPEYEFDGCGIYCESTLSNYTVYTGMGLFHSSLVLFALYMVVKVRKVVKQNEAKVKDHAAEAAANSASAFRESKPLAYVIYNTVFTSMVIYPATLLMPDKTSVAVTVMRSLGSIWSCLGVIVLLFLMKIKAKKKFDQTAAAQRRQATSNLMKRQEDRSARSSRSAGSPSRSTRSENSFASGAESPGRSGSRLQNPSSSRGSLRSADMRPTASRPAIELSALESDPNISDWKEASHEGKTYWYNRSTNESAWSAPPGWEAHVAATSARAATPPRGA